MRVAAELLLSGFPGASIDRRPDPVQPSAPGTHPPPPSLATAPLSRESTATTVPDVQPPRRAAGVPSRSHYGKSTTPTSPIPPIPNLLSPLRDPVHARLRHKALVRYIDCANRDAEAAMAEAASTDEEEDQLAPTDDDEVPETDFGGSSGTRRGLPQEARADSASQRTYGRTRTHVPSQPQPGPSERRRESAPEPEPEPESDPESEPGPNSRRLTPAALLLRERLRAVAAKVQTEAQGLLNRDQRARLFGEAARPPTSRPQLRLPPGTNSGAPGTRAQGSRRVDPIGAARADMIQFNEACARDEATSFVRAATRHDERRGPCGPLRSRSLNLLLEDDEELQAAAEAFANGKWPVSNIYPHFLTVS